MSWLFRTLRRYYGEQEPMPRGRRVRFTASTFAADRDRMLRNIASPIPFQNYLNEMRLLALDDLGKNHMTLNESAKIRKSANRMWKKLTAKMRSKYRTLAANAHKTTLTLDRLLDGNVYQPCRQMLIPCNDEMDTNIKKLRETILSGAEVARSRDVTPEVRGSSKTKGKQSGRRGSLKSLKGRKGPSQEPPLRKSKRLQAMQSQPQPQPQPQSQPQSQPRPQSQSYYPIVDERRPQEHQPMDLASQSLFRAQQLARSQVQSRSQSRPPSRPPSRSQSRSRSHSQSHSPSRTRHSHPHPMIPASTSRKRSHSTTGCSLHSSRRKDGEEAFLQPEYLMEYIINSNNTEDSHNGHRAPKRKKRNYIQN